MNPGAFPRDYVKGLCPHPSQRPAAKLVAAGLERLTRALAGVDEDGQPIVRPKGRPALSGARRSS